MATKQKPKTPDNTEEKQDRRKNLPQLFKPGQSGNPKGRPLGSQNMTTLLKYAMEHFSTGTETKFDELIIKRTLLKAAAGDNEMIKLTFDRIDGKAKEHVMHSIDKDAFKDVAPNVLADIMTDYQAKVKDTLRKGHGRTSTKTK